jgi:dipeptidyl aminopeptidase/acylaminoacyl peptidase
MQRDLRNTAAYREVENLFRAIRQPGTGQIGDAAEIQVSPDGLRAVFSGTLMDQLEGAAPVRICLVDLLSGDTRVVTFGPHTDRLAKYSPNGRQIAFLSDRLKVGDFQLYLLDPESGAARPTPRVEGWVEYLHWSPDGSRILLGTAGHGADTSSTQGAIASEQAAHDIPSWMPEVETGDESYRWRRAWMYELATGRVHPVSRASDNIWEAVWCGNAELAAVVSPGPGEGLWYSARLHILDAQTGENREVYAPNDQLGWPAASPSGKHLAVVEAVCSDRWLVAGDVLLVDTSSGRLQRLDTRGIDVTYLDWRSDSRLLLAGHRGFDTVVALYEVTSDTFTEVWSGGDITTGGRYVTVSGLNDKGDFALLGESFVRSPEVAVVRNGEYLAVKSFDLGYSGQAKAVKAVERVTWSAPDGLEIQGWLLRPGCEGPHPLVMNIHGGPVWHWRPVWLGRGTAFVLMLLKRGFAVFFPNPRGSAGQGQTFARHVLGDMGGADTFDFLSGLDHLVKHGVADPRRLGVTGISYGGFMTSWLVGQDNRFAAAVSVAPFNNQVTEHLVSNIPAFVSLFLADTYTNPGGKYFERSPIMHAHKVKTPTLSVCGALDRSAPPEEAVQFHNALLENGVESVLLTYPEEGHGIRKLPAAIDYTVRVLSWFEEHMSAEERFSCE